MRKIIIAILCSAIFLVCSKANDSVKNDSQNVSSIQMKTNVAEVQADYSLTDNEIDKIADKVTEKMKQETNKKTIVIVSNILRWIAIVIIAVILVLLSFIVWGCYKIYKKLKKIEQSSEYNRKEKAQTSAYPKGEIDKIAQNVEEIKNIIVCDNKKILEKTIAKVNTVENVSDICDKGLKEEINRIYAKPLQDGNLKATDEMEAIYIIDIKKGTTLGMFSVYEKDKQILRAIRNKEQILEQFCEATGSSINANGIKNIQKGEVELIRNGIWRVTKKAEIEFIK